MLVNIKEKEFINILEEYYKRELDIDGKINLCIENEFQKDIASISIKQQTKIDLLGSKLDAEREIEKDEIDEIFRVIFERQNLEINSLDFKTRVKREGSCYNDSEKVVFDNLEINFDAKDKVKKLGGM